MLNRTISLLALILASFLSHHANGEETFSFTASNSASPNFDNICTDSTSCHFSCIGSSACFRTNMTCANGADCVFTCTGYFACKFAHLRCNGASSCTVHCNTASNNDLSCTEINIHAKASPSLTVRATGSNVAQGANIWCPDAASCDLSFTGYQSGIDSRLYCGTDGDCVIDANGAQSLYGSSDTSYTVIDAEESNTLLIIATGKKALGLELSCPRNQATEAQCIIRMISDETTDYSNSEILYWNWIYIEQASDIEFQCEGPTYDAFFETSKQNEIRPYTWGLFKSCEVASFSYNAGDFYGTNVWKCSADKDNNDVLGSKACNAAPETEAPTTAIPTETTEAPTNQPTGIPTATTKAPTQSTASPTGIPIISPTEIPIISPTEIPTVSPLEMPTKTPIYVPTNSQTDAPTAPPSEAPSQHTVNPTKRPTSEDISAITPTDAPFVSREVTSAEAQVTVDTENEEEDSNDAREEEEAAQSTDALVVVILAFAVIALAVAGFIWYNANKIKQQQLKLAENNIASTGSYRVDTATAGGAGEDVEAEDTAAPGSPRYAHNNNNDNNDAGHRGTIVEEEEEEEEEKDSDEVKDWLAHVGLPMYYDCFVENGLTSLQFIQCVSEQKDLHNIGVMLVGHQMVLMGEIMKLRQSEIVKEFKGGTETNGGEGNNPEGGEGGGAITRGGIDYGVTNGLQYDAPDGDHDDQVADNVIMSGITAGGDGFDGMGYNAPDGNEQVEDNILMGGITEGGDEYGAPAGNDQDVDDIEM